MFGLFNKKKNGNKDGYDPDRITLHYEGDVMSIGDYEAYTLNRADPCSKQEYPSHMFVPDGVGKITYKDGDKIMEQYEGEFPKKYYQEFLQLKILVYLQHLWLLLECFLTSPH